MNHPIYRITSCEHIAPYSWRLRFDDGLVRTVDLEPILEGELYGPLRDPAVFAQVTLDPEIHTAVWPCGAGILELSIQERIQLVELIWESATQKRVWRTARNRWWVRISANHIV